MIETLISVVGKLISASAWIAGKVRRPRISRRLAPLDIFEQFGPGTSIERMKELLGAPYREQANRYGYKFSDALVQIESENGMSISALGVALTRKGWRDTFEVYPHPMKLILGRTTLGDVLEEGMKVNYESSSKEDLLFVQIGYGFPSLYRNFTFGVIHAPFLQGADFVWDHNNSRLLTDPKNIRLNWVAVSFPSDQATLFDYWLFM